ncbi:hypothetical protein Csa_011686 [Cucumis sativus]|uniref:Uncharacterized protein n=1 Tax=Cucumis sativus TaxID=3659 RepID=A0A0A0L9A6_CUCSA|nr:hypothetical protein Csa_011686 [Cucumis sativus]
MGKGNNSQKERKCGCCHTKILVSVRLNPLHCPPSFATTDGSDAFPNSKSHIIVLHFQPFDSNNHLEKHNTLLFVV